MEPYEAIEELVALIRGQYSVFIKTENYVPAHITASDKKKTIGDDWTEDRLRDYLYGEAMLNHNFNGPMSKGETVSIFIGEAKYHTWIRHYRVSKTLPTGKAWDWTYTWERLK